MVTTISYVGLPSSYFYWMKSTWSTLSDLHKQVYSISTDPLLDSLILWPLAINIDQQTLDVCTCCHDVFTSDSLSMPNWILANNLTLIPLPDSITDITCTEVQLVCGNTRSHNIATMVVQGNVGNTCLRSHVLAFGADPFIGAATIPFNLLEQETFLISIVGGMTTEEKALTAKQYKIRPSKTLELLRLCMDRRNKSIIDRLKPGFTEQLMKYTKGFTDLFNL